LVTTGGEYNLIGEIRMLRKLVLEFHRGSLIKADLEVLATSERTERARRLVRDTQHALLVANHLANGISGVPHERPGLQSAAIADSNDALAIGVPGEILNFARESHDLNFQRVLRVVVGPYAHAASLVARSNPVSIGGELRRRHLRVVSFVHKDVIVRVRDATDHHQLATRVDELVARFADTPVCGSTARSVWRGRIDTSDVGVWETLDGIAIVSFKKETIRDIKPYDYRDLPIF
jgi:hypothetical protein